MHESDPASHGLQRWLRNACTEYVFDLRGVYRRSGDHGWPLTAQDESDLESQLASGGHLLPLPKEPAALANVLEVSVVDYLLARLATVPDVRGRRGTERGYPDVEVSGPAFGGGFHAIDIKIAQRRVGKRGPSANTQSRITLYTGNTYFRYPRLHWPGTFRPFADYASHLDVIGVYTLTDTAERVEGLELIVQPPWRIASRQRSSTTREYIGAVVNIEDLREGRGEFATEEEFYRFWRKYPFKVGVVVQQQLDKLLAGQQAPSGTLTPPPPELPL
jgi:hypothetical protein